MKSRSKVSSPAGFIIFPARNKRIVRESAGNRDALLCHSCRCGDRQSRHRQSQRAFDVLQEIAGRKRKALLFIT